MLDVRDALMLDVRDALMIDKATVNELLLAVSLLSLLLISVVIELVKDKFRDTRTALILFSTAIARACSTLIILLTVLIAVVSELLTLVMATVLVAKSAFIAVVSELFTLAMTVFAAI